VVKDVRGRRVHDVCTERSKKDLARPKLSRLNRTRCGASGGPGGERTRLAKLRVCTGQLHRKRRGVSNCVATVSGPRPPGSGAFVISAGPDHAG
jgi:hypothetical protein